MLSGKAHRFHSEPHHMPFLIFPCHWTLNCTPKHKYPNIQSYKTLHWSQEHTEVGGIDLHKGKLLCTLDITLQPIASFVESFVNTFSLSFAKHALSLVSNSQNLTDWSSAWMISILRAGTWLLVLPVTAIFTNNTGMEWGHL